LNSNAILNLVQICSLGAFMADDVILNKSATIER
jgi:hypothetical protein